MANLLEQDSRRRAPLPFPEVPVYLFYGNQVDAVLRARDQVVDAFLPAELRDENLTEYRAAGNRFGIDLIKTLPQIAGDLDTLSLIAESAKIAVVINPAELFAGAGRARRPARKKKAPRRTATKSKAKPKDENAESDREAAALRWMTEVLPGTGNRLVLIAHEDESEGREVSDRSSLFQTIARIGHTQAFRDSKAFFRIEDALMRRDAPGLMRAIDDLWKPGKGDQAVYGGVVRCMRFMLQANIIRERDLAEDSERAVLLLPARAQFNILRGSDWVRRKYLSRPPAYRTTALLEAYREMLSVYRALRPTLEDLHVAEARPLLERTLLQLIASPPPRH